MHPIHLTSTIPIGEVGVTSPDHDRLKLSYCLLREITSTTLIAEVAGGMRVAMRPHPMHAPPAMPEEVIGSRVFK